MDTYANEDAMIYFCRDILPQIKKRVPTVRLYIVGNNPTAKVRRLGNDAAVVVTGLVRDIRSFIRKAAVVVVPIRVGGGTRLKILEAMAIGRPVVSTSVGCEGLDVVPGEQILVADTTREFAEEVAGLISGNGAGRDELAARARQLVEETYDWRIIAGKLERAYEEGLGRAGPAPGGG